MEKKNRKRIWVLNAGFVIVGIGIITFLWMAPEETTARLPMDDIHKPFHGIKSKKEAEKNCTQCHAESGVAPLSAEHPPKFRCLFCHKR